MESSRNPWAAHGVHALQTDSPSCKATSTLTNDMNRKNRNALLWGEERHSRCAWKNAPATVAWWQWLLNQSPKIKCDQTDRIQRIACGHLHIPASACIYMDAFTHPSMCTSYAHLHHLDLNKHTVAQLFHFHRHTYTHTRTHSQCTCLYMYI